MNDKTPQKKFNNAEIIGIILAENGLSKRKFAEILGISPTAIYEILNGKTKKITGNVAKAITEKFPQYSSTWIMTGTGDIHVNNGNVGASARNIGSVTQNNGDDRLVDIIKSQQTELSKYGERIDRLITLLERKDQ